MTTDSVRVCVRSLTPIKFKPSSFLYVPQLWGAAVPLNRHSAPFLLDGDASVGVCGDWFTPAPECRGPSIESAYLSGRKLADAVALNLADKNNSNKNKDYGLDSIHYFEVRESSRVE